MTFFIRGLDQPVAIVGDSLFAGSMGGGNVSYEDAVRNNLEKILTLPNDTILCPGHGPMTTVAEEKKHNAFFAGETELSTGLELIPSSMNVAFVGVGRMGANMARRLQERGFHITAVYDAHRAAATELAQELGSFASQSLGEVTAAADVIITVVSDDAAMRQIFSPRLTTTC